MIYVIIVVIGIILIFGIPWYHYTLQYARANEMIESYVARHGEPSADDYEQLLNDYRRMGGIFPSSDSSRGKIARLLVFAEYTERVQSANPTMEKEEALILATAQTLELFNDA